MIRIIKNVITNKEIRFGYFDKMGFFNHLSDEDYLCLKFKNVFGYELDFTNLRTFNEKLQWIKLYDRNPLYTTMVDKVLVKEYVKSVIGDEYIIPTLGVWNRPEDINFDELPKQFVLKCNHNSGLGMYICENKSTIKESKIKKNLMKGLNENYFLRGREWPYKNVARKILAEKYMGKHINDYKLQCFYGKVDNVLICNGRDLETGVKYYYFDTEWNYLPYSIQIDKEFDDYDSLKPYNLSEMVRLAEVLSSGIPEVRVDFYEIDKKIYFGELTFFTQSGFDTTITRNADLIMGNKFLLPNY